jgi:hypothetical protein
LFQQIETKAIGPKLARIADAPGLLFLFWFSSMAQTALADTSAAAASYISQQQCARQWRGFLHALGAEFVSALAPEDLHTLMARVGTRFASEQAPGPCQTLEELQQAMSRIWMELDWGYVLLTQHAEHLEITHHYSPLVAAFGREHAAWSSGFLQGVYQRWFDAAGSEGLRVVLTAPADAWGSAVFHLSR